MRPFKTPKQAFGGSNSLKKLFNFDNIFESNRSHKSTKKSSKKDESQSKKQQLRDLENI